MDEYTHLLQAMEMDEEDDDDDDLLFMQATAVAMVMFVGAEESRRLRAERRQPNRLYLCRSELMPFPRLDSAWQRLYCSRVNRAYITTMGIDVPTFDIILESGFRQCWNETPIPRDDTTPAGVSRPDRRCYLTVLCWIHDPVVVRHHGEMSCRQYRIDSWWTDGGYRA